MDELVNAIVKKTGLPKAQAKAAAEAAVDFLKERLPAPIAGQLDNILENPSLAKGAEELLDKGLGLFGKK
jgi:hypothetical protein